ncbi:MAG TPA: 50S ribosomal protein L4 [Kofleriaceae bacterium]|nr:50S ribosomal protein L4 [Kofleriaceae bacterium]
MAEPLKIDVRDIAGKTVGSIELDGSVFSEDVNEHLLWEVVKWQRAKARSGTAMTKTRGEVRGSKIKPWRQKGTGRARSGDRSSPIWVGGGQTFGPRPRDYEYSMPRKARRKALRAALSLRAREQKIIVLDEFPAQGGKTRAVTGALRALGAPQPTSKVLIVEASDNAELVRGTRNLRACKWLAPEGLNVYDVLNHETLVLTRSALERVQDALRPVARTAAES